MLWPVTKALFTRTAKLDLGGAVRGAHELWASIMQKVLAAKETVVEGRAG